MLTTDMTEQDHRLARRWRSATIVLAATVALLIVTAAGAAQRVVLGEYFTNLY